MAQLLENCPECGKLYSDANFFLQKCDHSAPTKADHAELLALRAEEILQSPFGANYGRISPFKELSEALSLYRGK